MSMSDYGVIAKKNGRVITTEWFTPMKDTIGVRIEKDTEGNLIEEDYFVFLGDEEFYVAIYKGCLTLFKGDKRIKSIYDKRDCVDTEIFYEVFENVEFKIQRLDEAYRYYVEFEYKDNLYEAMYGFGIGIEFLEDMKSDLKIRVEEFLRNK